MTTELTPAVRAAAEAILDHIAPGMEHTSVNQNVDTYADMAKHIVDYVTPEIFDAVAELVVHKFPEEFTKEFMVEQLRQSANFRRAQLVDAERRLYDAMFSQPEGGA
jgi:hypothetical protein